MTIGSTALHSPAYRLSSWRVHVLLYIGKHVLFPLSSFYIGKYVVFTSSSFYTEWAFGEGHVIMNHGQIQKVIRPVINR